MAPALLAGIVAIAFALRLWHLDYGLPALLDPDEPIFVLGALKLIRDHTLNPGWFGHPGSTTIYALTVIAIATYGAWHAAGRFVDPVAFGHAIYVDPSIVFLPGRLFIVACGLATILFCALLARRLFGVRVALIAALLLAIDPLHVRYSQIIRTDMHAAVFVLVEMLAALAIARRGRTRDYLAAALCLGFATATKWPAAACAAAVAGAAALRWIEHPEERRAIAGRLALFAAASPVALFVASPYLFLDWRTLLVNLHGEERPIHLGATGFGFLGNVGWYLGGPLAAALGPPGLALAFAGCWIGARRSRAFAAVVLPVMFAFLAMIAAQALVWERWVVPLLPPLSIAAAVAIDAIVRAVRDRRGARPAAAALAASLIAVAVPMLVVARAQAAERGADTRRLATAWARAHIAPGSSVLVEYLAMDVLPQPWRFLYPAGIAGCIDGRAALTGQVRYSQIEGFRGAKDRPILDIGTVAPAALASCRGDWAILTNYDRYLAEEARFPEEVASYRRYLAGATIAASFAPVPGRIGGPIVRVVRLR